MSVTMYIIISLIILLLVSGLFIVKQQTAAILLSLSSGYTNKNAFNLYDDDYFCMVTLMHCDSFQNKHI